MAFVFAPDWTTQVQWQWILGCDIQRYILIMIMYDYVICTYLCRKSFHLWFWKVLFKRPSPLPKTHHDDYDLTITSLKYISKKQPTHSTTIPNLGVVLGHPQTTSFFSFTIRSLLWQWRSPCLRKVSPGFFMQKPCLKHQESQLSILHSLGPKPRLR